MSCDLKIKTRASAKMAINTNHRNVSREIEIQNAISERIRSCDCVQKIQHKQYVELKLKQRCLPKWL